jgi:hypothetical protein
VSKNVFRKSRRLWDSVEKVRYSRTGHRWQYNTAHALCVLDNESYTHTHSEYVIFIHFPPQYWLRERASILYVQSLPFQNQIKEVCTFSCVHNIQYQLHQHFPKTGTNVLTTADYTSNLQESTKAHFHRWYPTPTRFFGFPSSRLLMPNIKFISYTHSHYTQKLVPVYEVHQA